MSEANRVWRLRKRPIGEITDDVLSFEEESLPEPGEGEFLFRLNYLSLDPTNRIWMSDARQYMPPVALAQRELLHAVVQRVRLAEAHVAGRADNSRLLWQLLMLDRTLVRLGAIT